MKTLSNQKLNEENKQAGSKQVARAPGRHHDNRQTLASLTCAIPVTEMATPRLVYTMGDSMVSVIVFREIL